MGSKTMDVRCQARASASRIIDIETRVVTHQRSHTPIASRARSHFSFCVHGFPRCSNSLLVQEQAGRENRDICLSQSHQGCSCALLTEHVVKSNILLDIAPEYRAPAVGRRHDSRGEMALSCLFGGCVFMPLSLPPAICPLLNISTYQNWT